MSSITAIFVYKEFFSFMQILHAVTEHDMVATFLKAEINSERWNQVILDILERDCIDRKIIDEPDTSNVEENHYRLHVLGGFRGYKQHRGMFESFPDTVSWYRAVLRQADLAQVRYIDYSYWVVLSNGSRLPSDAAPKYSCRNPGVWTKHGRLS